MAKILIKFPTRNRQHIFLSTFELYYSMLSGKHDYEFRVSMDVDDKTMNCSEVWNKLDPKKNVMYCYGHNRSKIEAINANMDNLDCDVILLASDDMVPIVHGYDDIIMTQMQQHYPNYDGALHFNDGRSGATLITLSILGRKLYDQLGYIYHPQYKSLWCDNEFTDVVRNMNKVTYIEQTIIKHSWTDLTGGDVLHRRNESFHNKDKRVYQIRKAAGFPSKNVEIPTERKRRRSV